MHHTTPRDGPRLHFFLRMLAGGLVVLSGAMFAAPPAYPAIQLLYGEDEIFPSALISTTKDSPFPPRISQQGDPVGLIAVQLISPSDDCPVTITLAATAISRESSFSVVLPRRGELYRIAPYLVLDHARIVELKHPIPREVLRATITLPGETIVRTRQVRIHAINDALVGAIFGRKLIDASYLTAAYINENNAEIPETLIRRALTLPASAKNPAGPRFIESFVGYAGGPDVVKREVESIYRALQSYGFKYSAATRASVAHSTLAGAQWVRLSSDSFRSEQANCVDGTVILASVLTHLRLRVVVFIRPYSHTFMGVFLKPTGDDLKEDMLVVETTKLGTDDFAAAVSTGRGLLDEHIGLIGRNTGKAGRKLSDFKSPELAELRIKEGLDVREMIQPTALYIIDVQEARQKRGIMPVPELMPGSRWRFPELPR